MDKGIAVKIVLLDFSAALDAIDHSVLFDGMIVWNGLGHTLKDRVIPEF